MFTRILVPLDGSKTAEGVLPYVISEASHHDAVVVLLRVIAPLRQSLMTIPSVMSKAYEQVQVIAEEYLETVTDKLQKEGLTVETIVERGSPALITLQVAEEGGCDLIILGSHGETSQSQWRFGSVANKIIKSRSPIPMLIIGTHLKSIPVN